jgi:hypothetical protein
MTTSAALTYRVAVKRIVADYRILIPIAYPRNRAIAPATICIKTPTIQPSQIIIVQKMCVSWRSTMIPTDEKADRAARNVPTALRNSAESTFEIVSSASSCG